jgi:hypothetical protein
MKMTLTTELELYTNDGGCITLDALNHNFLVMYNDPAGKGLASASDISLGDLYMDLACGEVYSIIVSDIEVSDDDGDPIGQRDIVVYASAITSIFATSDRVAV